MTGDHLWHTTGIVLWQGKRVCPLYSRGQPRAGGLSYVRREKGGGHTHSCYLGHPADYTDACVSPGVITITLVGIYAEGCTQEQQGGGGG